VKDNPNILIEKMQSLGINENYRDNWQCIREEELSGKNWMVES